MGRIWRTCSLCADTVLLKDVPAAELQAELSLDYHPSGLISASQIPLFEITVQVCPSAQT